MGKPNESDFKLFWGDLHFHSSLSPCFQTGCGPEGHDGSQHECYEYARDVAGMDFAACTDHDCSNEKPVLTDEDWAGIRQTAAEVNDPGRFVVFSAYEWTNTRQGHYAVYYLGDDGPLVRVSDYPLPGDLWAALRTAGYSGETVMTVPHHLAKWAVANDWDWFDPELEPIVEITSAWGNYEHWGNPYECDPNWSASKPGHFAQDGLARGYRFGFLGGGDIHDGRAGGHLPSWQECPLPEKFQRLRTLRRNPLGGGITGVYARELTREDIFEAIRARRTIAATGEKTELRMWIDGTFLGGQVRAEGEQHERRQITVTAQSDVPLRTIEIVRNGLTLFRTLCSDTSESLEFTDEYALEKVLPLLGSDGAGGVYYYARVTREDDRMAWSSPIWLDF